MRYVWGYVVLETDCLVDFPIEEHALAESNGPLLCVAYSSAWVSADGGVVGLIARHCWRTSPPACPSGVS